MPAQPPKPAKVFSIKHRQVGTYRKVNDEDVQLVFTKACDCHDDNVKKIFPCDVANDGISVPICKECGSDYNYDRVEVRHSI